MVAETIRDIFDLFTHVRARMVRHTKQHTLKEMARLPRHLIDDVNARGLPSDRLPPRRGESEQSKPLISLKVAH
jgi:hypothetical protein